jgi:hypothetical protein
VFTVASTMCWVMATVATIPWFLKYAPQCLEFEEGLVDQLEESYDGVMAFCRDLR